MTRTTGGIGLTIDYAALERDHYAIGRVALPAATAAMLTNAAFHAQRSLTASVDDVFDRPARRRMVCCNAWR